MTFLVSLLPSLVAAAAALSDGTPVPAAPQDAPAPPPVYPQWSGGLAAGTILTEGNSDTLSGNAAFNAQRRDEKDRWTFDAYWNWAQQGTDSSASVGEDTDDDQVTTLNYGGGVKYDYFQTAKLYYYGNAAGKVDPIADLQLRYLAGAGAGWQVREDEKLKWGTELGLSWVDENFEGDDDDADFLAVRVASNLSWAISSSTSFEQVAEAYPSLEDSEDFIAKLDNRLKMTITGKWIAQLQYVLDYDDSTPPGVSEADHRVVLGLGWSFGAI